MSQVEGMCGWTLIPVKTSSSPRKLYPKLKIAGVSTEIGVRVDFTFYFTFAYFEFFCCFYFYTSSIWKKKTAIFLEKVWLFLKSLRDSQTQIFSDCTIGINVEKK